MSKRYRVRERVVFEYVWIIEADAKPSKAVATDMIDGRGDGEAESHDERERKVTRVELIGGAS